MMAQPTSTAITACYFFFFLNHLGSLNKYNSMLNDQFLSLLLGHMIKQHSLNSKRY